jgi:hypothetical protein
MCMLMSLRPGACRVFPAHFRSTSRTRFRVCLCVRCRIAGDERVCKDGRRSDADGWRNYGACAVLLRCRG